jgi:serine/threonine-protein kinase RsbW
LSDKTDDVPEVEVKSAKVTLVIPCRAEYVGVARLAILGVANRLSYSYDDVEDVRLAVGEACTHAVERAAVASPRPDEPTIWIDIRVSGDGLEIEVRDNVGPAAAGAAQPEDEDAPGLDKQDLGSVLMEILVDKFSIQVTPQGTTVFLIKNAPQHSINGS